MAKNQAVIQRRKTQWVLLSVVIVTIGLGWKYPVLGFSVPIVMLAGMVGGIIKGRYVCGNICPRGSFFDRLISRISLGRDIPDFARKMPLRWTIFTAMMGFMVYRVSQDPGNWRHWGMTFWVMCVVTTAIGVVLGILTQPRMWCAFCPMGTMQNALGGGRQQLVIEAALCKECRICEKVCPAKIPIVQDKDKGRVTSRDCLKCPECTAVCPTKALHWPEKVKN
jgi:ferredoxin-type protein NapH